MPLTNEDLAAAVGAYELHGSYRAAAAALGLPTSTFQRRLERAQAADVRPRARGWTYPRSLTLDVTDGAVLIGGDGHFWPGPVPAIWRTFCAVAKSVKPVAVILNGDMIDGTRISKHGRLRGQHAPRVVEELDAARENIAMLPRGVAMFWTVGNHDQRVDIYLANQAPEMDDFAGSLQDRFPGVKFGYAVTINDDVEVRHRMRGGMHAAWNNSLHTGRTIVTNHTHQLERKAIVNRRGRMWGIETGMLNEPHAPQFEYTEGQQTRWTAGFVLLTFKAGRLLPPELCETVDGTAYFRGKSWI